MVEDKSITHRIGRIRALVSNHEDSEENFELGMLAKTVLVDTVGAHHPLMESLSVALTGGSRAMMTAACRTLLTLHEQGALRSPALRVARDLEGEIFDVAEAQVKAAEKSVDVPTQQMRLAVAAFLAGAALEDALRRLCDENGIRYDAARTSIAKLQAALYSPAQGVEAVSLSDNKAITYWGGTRNDADRGHFSVSPRSAPA